MTEVSTTDQGPERSAANARANADAIRTIRKLALAAEKSEEWELASRYWFAVSGLAPSSARYRFKHAISLERVGNLKAAIDAYKAGLALDPDASSWFRLGKVATKAKDWELARTAYRQWHSRVDGAEPIELQMIEDEIRWFPVRRAIFKFAMEVLPKIQMRISSIKPEIAPHSPRVFVYWDRGFDEAPPIVRVCFRRLVEINSSMEIVQLKSDTWQDWVDLPPQVVSKLAPNMAHFSDVLRVALLAKYGGIWIDATCYCAQPLIELYNSSLATGWLAYRISKIRISNWFLCSSGGNYVARLFFEALSEYWERFEKPTNYFFFHHLFEALYRLDDEVKRAWDPAEVLLSLPAADLQSMMFQAYDADQFQKLLASSAIHKLTHKLKSTPKAGDIISHILADVP